LYIDPVSGLSCFTAYSHLKRGECCGKACRHCPYGHFNAVPRARKNTLNRPVLLRARQPSALDNRVVLLWEGSVFDAAALAPLRAEAKVTLCTEFSIDAQATTGSRLPIAVVFDQARALRDVDLLMLPFSAPRDSLAQAAAVVVANAVLCFRADAAPADAFAASFPTRACSRPWRARRASATRSRDCAARLCNGRRALKWPPQSRWRVCAASSITCASSQSENGS